jgi:hypothetical protein
VGKLRKTSGILIPVLIFLFFLPAARAEYTIFENTTYKDWYLYYKYPEFQKWVFFSTRYINETRYFAIGIYQWYNYSYWYLTFRVIQFDKFGNIENERVFYTQGYDVSWDLNTEGTTVFYNYENPDDILIPIRYSRAYSGLTFIRFNITDWIQGGNGISLIITGLDPSGGINIYEVSPYLTATFPPEINQRLVALIGGSLCYDFYNTSSSSLTGTSKCFVWTTGLSDIKRAYVYQPAGHCRVWNDCLFQVIVEANSSQHNNRKAVYLREIHKGLFGWEFSDVPLFTCDGWGGAFPGAVSYRGRVDRWAMYTFYPIFAYKIYIRIYDNPQPQDIRYFYIQYDEKWYPMMERAINVIESNAFTPYTKYVTIPSMPYGSPPAYLFLGTIDTNLNKSKYLYSFINIGTYGSEYGTLGMTTVSLSQVDYYNSSNSRTDILFGTNERGGHGYSLLAKTALINATKVNVTYIVTLGQNMYVTGGTISSDVSKGIFLMTQSYLGSEAFFRYDPIATVSPYSSWNIGFQIPEEYCLCNPWQSMGCYNSTHEYWVRTCSPPACSQEMMFVYNASCGGAPPSPPLQRCMDINQSGTYTLQSDITADRDICIWVKASDVTLDLNGHTLSGAKTGILVQPETPTKLKNIVIRNGEIHGFEKGIFISYTENSGISSINFTSNQVALLIGGETRGIEIKGNKFSVTPYLNTYGIRVEGYTRDNLIEDNEFMDMTANIYVPNGALYFSRIMNNKFGNVTVFPECCVEKTIWLLPFPIPVNTKTCLVPCGQIYRGALSGIICNDCGYNDFVGNYYFANNTDATFSNSEGNRFIYEAFERIPNSTNGLFLDQSTRNNWGCSVQGSIYDSGINNTFVSTCPSTLYPNQTIYCVAGWKCVDSETIGYQMTDCSWYETHKCPSGKICVEGVCTSIAPPPAPPMPPEAPYEPVINRTLFTEAGADWMAFFFTPIFFATLMLVGIAGFITLAIAKYGGGQFAPAAFIIISMIMIAIYGIYQIYPPWLVIVLIILAGFVFAKFVLGVI